MIRGRKVLVTGGAGYIGSHTVVELCHAGYEPIIVDNFSNSKKSVLTAIDRLCGRPVPWEPLDVRDRRGLLELLRHHGCSAVLHFAGLKAVGESVRAPLDYYDNNVNGALALLQAMAQAGCKQLVFSSSATVYGAPRSLPIDESHPVLPINPYGHTKAMTEQMLRDLAAADPEWNIALLRYFNPVGAHESGLIGEDPNGIPNNLLPFVAQVAVGKRPRLSIYGNDYDTSDGTGVRDYIHVVDLARGHVAALGKLPSLNGARALNLGTGRGTSVLDMVRQFEQACGAPIPYEIAPRRSGDVGTVYADPTRAARELGWTAQHGIERMCADAWRWQSLHPQGFD